MAQYLIDTNVLLRLVGVRGTIGKQVHDAHIVALLNAHSVSHLLTFNVSDFAAYSINAVSPAAIPTG